MTPMSDALIAEDLLLLLTNDQTGKLLVASNRVDIALGGALLIELALMQRVDVAREDGIVRKGRLLVQDGRPTSDSLLDEALGRVAAKRGKKPKDVLPGLGKGVQALLHARLAERGLLHAETAKILGVFPSHRWPSNDGAHEAAVRAALVTALRSGRADDAREAALIALLHALKAVTKVIDPASVGLSKAELKANAGQIAEDDWAAKAVREAIDAALAIVAASSSAAAVSGGG
jgi:Golgi phosphoprotein 3 (GPP34)